MRNKTARLQCATKMEQTFHSPGLPGQPQQAGWGGKEKKKKNPTTIGVISHLQDCKYHRKVSGHEPFRQLGLKIQTLQAWRAF